ncbi:methyltransferase, TIGR04325 family [Paenibacillus campi]|uniref:methyltransferase, TIGR04325 family n=1 Tax=Paenibacillus campi TaxID=3106031 RepID=UPI002AFF375E|nr:methyltransferase, TIGR04325 family [Paenibacillus sp. SGZ-1009]
MIIKIKNAVELVKDKARYRDIVIFGSGSGAQHVKSFCDHFGIRIDYAVDNNEHSQKFNESLNLEVKSPAILNHARKNVYVLISSMYYREISEQLQSFDLKEIEDFSDFIHFSNLDPKGRYGFFGNYASYEEALKQSTGYENPIIIEKIKQYTITHIKNLETRLDTRSQQLLTSFAHIQATMPKNEYRILDFGGGMGVHYYTLKAFLPPTVRFQWVVFETPSMSAAGKENFANDELSFINKSELEYAAASGEFDFIIASSFVQHTDDPETYFNIIKSFNTLFILMNRLQLIEQEKDILSVQYVDPTIYDASYPAWFLAENKWLNLMQQEHDILFRWSIPEDEAYLDHKHKVIGQGMLLKAKAAAQDG